MGDNLPAPPRRRSLFDIVADTDILLKSKHKCLSFELILRSFQGPHLQF